MESSRKGHHHKFTNSIFIIKVVPRLILKGLPPLGLPIQCSLSQDTLGTQQDMPYYQFKVYQ